MPVQTTYPGVYIQEAPSGVHTIVGVSTSVTAFVGAAAKGPSDQPTPVTSFAEYVRTFGQPDDQSQPMGYAVSHYFQNGGTQAVIVRALAGDAQTASVQLDDREETGKPILQLDAKGAGSWANSALELGIAATVANGSANANDLFDLEIDYGEADPRSPTPVVAKETYSNLSMSPKHPRYAPNVLAASSLVDASVVAATVAAATAVAGTSATKETVGDDTEISSGANTVRVSVDFGPAVDVVLFPGATTQSYTAAQIVKELGDRLAALGATASSPEGGGPITLTSKTTGPNSSVVVSPAPSSDLSQTLGLGLAWGGTEISGSAALRPATIDSAGLTGGSDGSTVVAADIVPEGGSGGVYALSSLRFPRFNLLSLPGVTTGDVAQVQAALSYCAGEHGFLIVDSGSDDWSAAAPDLGSYAAYGEHGAVYYPRVQQVESLPGGTTRTLDLPPSGAIAGVFARTDTNRGIWKAPAGLEAGVTGISALTQASSDVVSGVLNPHGVNVLRDFPAAGIVVWGARTLRGDDTLSSDYKYVPVRRLADYIESSLYLGTQFAVFEPNDPDLWGQLRLAVTTFMRGLFRQGAFQQSSKRDEASSFFVVCDDSVNPQSEIDLGRVNIVVGFAPLKPAEFVVVTITQISHLED